MPSPSQACSWHLLAGTAALDSISPSTVLIWVSAGVQGCFSPKHSNVYDLTLCFILFCFLLGRILLCSPAGLPGSGTINMYCCAQFRRSSLLSNLWGRRGSQAGYVACLQLSIWEHSPNESQSSACVFPTAICPIYPENAFMRDGICYLTLPTGSSRGCRFSACYKQNPLSGSSQALYAKTKRLYCELFTSIWGCCAPQTLPGDRQPLSEPFSDVVRTCVDSLPVSLWETGLLLCLQPTLPVCGPGAGPGDWWDAGRLAQHFHK